jgi:hypothetical protein
MLELIILGLVFWLGYQIGFAVLSYKLRHLLYKEAKKQGIVIPYQDNVLEEEQLPTVSQLMVEKANDILYLYNREDETFVCQGSTIEELAVLAKEYKNIKYAAVLHDNDVVAFVDGKIRTTL